MNENEHSPVLLNEVLNGLSVQPNGCYVDCTFGRGGHSEAILRGLDESGRLYLLDKDPEAISYARHKFSVDARVTCIHAPFSALANVLEKSQCIGGVKGILFDLGVSSPQLDNAMRGFSFMRDGDLDMRMDPTSGVSAAEWINEASPAEISTVLREYGEERHAKRIAGEIVQARSITPIQRTRQLADLITRVMPVKERDKHPATRSFQAIRIFVNKELEELRRALSQVVDVLDIGGRLAVISFHSLEDRIVKRFIREEAEGDPFPKDLPIPATALNPRLKIIDKGVRASKEEIMRNPRARSAVLRTAEKIAE